MSQFAFLQLEWPLVYQAARKAEELARGDARTACFYARRALELAVHWAYKADPALRLPYQDNLSALVHEPSFKQAAGEPVFRKARILVTLGNRAVHDTRAIPPEDAITAVRELFHVGYWLARQYGRRSRPDPGLRFDPARLPVPPAQAAARSAVQLEKLQRELQARDENLATLLADKQALDTEIAQLRVEVARAKEAAARLPDAHDYSEAETRDAFIDLLLHEAGWPLAEARDREFEVAGMPNEKGTGFVDYVLWGEDGKPLGLVEAKRTRRDARVGQQQAKLYADCLERMFGQRPVIFYSNGYEHWIWDDGHYPPRAIQGFYTKAELQLLVQRRGMRRPLAQAPINAGIVERVYQEKAIRRVAEAFERGGERKALLVMATGSGKTRTAIALCDLLLRCNWAKRILFLADRVALVNQALNAFKQHLPDASPVNLVTERNTQGRVYVSTYPTMLGLIDSMADGQRRFGPGYFDLIIIDEAHRSVFDRYGAILEWFDALLLGLTATPKDEVSHSTYRLFELEPGVPTDAYGLEEAVHDGYLVPPRAISVRLKFPREGIRYDELSDEEKEQWDAMEWDTGDGTPPREIGSEALNRWLFNKDTVDKALAHLMERGLKVAGGDTLGKTIIFAKNQLHAQFIAERFDANYPHYAGHFARVITYRTEYAQSLIDDFGTTGKDPHIAISVDMLDTGIDVPDVVNLVFFKQLHSKIKFWQMLGRGTRLRPDLFGPGQDKKYFLVFDYCGNLEYFSQELPASEGATGATLATRLFNARLELIAALDRRDMNAAYDLGKVPWNDPTTEADLRGQLARLLHEEVAAMNLDNFIVRPHRKLVERYARADAWGRLPDEERRQLSHQVAGLPSGRETDAEEARRFDLLALRLQLALLQQGPDFEPLRRKVQAIAGALTGKGSIPMVARQMVLIEAVQGDEWWQDVTAPLLEVMRLRLRGLVQFIDRAERSIVYSDFEDELQGEGEVVLPAVPVGTDAERFTDKARAFLRQHLDHPAVTKLRGNQPLTRQDMRELEALLESGRIGSPEDIRGAADQAHGLGLLVRALVGMEHKAAREALGRFTAGKTFSASQLEFVEMIIAHLTENGVIEAGQLYESPFTDVAPSGPEMLFSEPQIHQLVVQLDAIRRSALPG
ncbi:MAG: DEAD/DEAH box helicase family protein [Gammaproteobacteria bacterium]|nr:DEAD/DEAH box helicase family protein [Gammaproteobacteria bacterium]